MEKYGSLLNRFWENMEVQMRKIGKIRKFIKRILEKYGSLDEKKWKNMEVLLYLCKNF